MSDHEQQAPPPPDGASGGIVRRAGISIGGSAIGGAMVLLNEVLAARFLGLRVYGLYALAVVFARIGEILSSSGLPVGLLRFLAIYRSQGRYDRVLGTILAATLLPVAVGSALAGGIWVLAPILATRVFHQPDVTPYLRCFAIAIPLMGLSEILGVVTRAYGYAVYYSLIRHVAYPAAYMAGLVALTACRADPRAIGLAFVAAYVLAAAAGLGAVTKVAGREVRHVRPAFSIGALYHYSFPIMINAILYLVLGVTDIVMIGYFSDPAQVGIYRGAMQMVIVFELVVVAFNAAAAHLYPVLVKDGRTEELRAAYGTVTRWLGIMATGGFVLVALNRHDLLGLLGPNFTAGSTALLVLVAGQIIKCSMGSSGFILVISGHQTLETRNAAIGVLASVATNLALIPRYGIVGAAAATSVAHVLINALRVRQVQRVLGLSTLAAPLVRSVAVAGGVWLLAWAAAGALGVGDGSGPACLAGRLGATAACLAGAMWLFVEAPARAASRAAAPVGASPPTGG